MFHLFSRINTSTTRCPVARHRRSFVPTPVGQSALEARRVLSTASLSAAGVLTVTGTSGPDTINVLQSGSTLTAAGSTFAIAAVRSIVVNGLDGSDAISVTPAVPATIYGGSGANTYPSVPDTDTIVDPVLTGGWAMSKAVMDKYQSFGGTNSTLLGQPTGAEVAADGGRVASFQGGEIDYSPATGAHVIQGLIYWESVATAKETDAYGTPVRTILGLATSDESGTTGGRVSHFQGGDVYWSATTGAHVVYGSILGELNATASETDAYGTSVRTILGLPTSDEAAASGGRVVHFQGGDVYWSATTGAHVVYGSILGELNATANETDPAGKAVRTDLGLPTADEAAANGGRVTHLQGGDVYWSAATGAHVVYGSIASNYAALGKSASLLGLPTTDEVNGALLTQSQQFQGGNLNAGAGGSALGASRNQAIAALNASQTDGKLDSTEFAYLKAIAASPFPYTNPITRDLMSKLINGDAANAHFQGGAVGNLQVGSPAWMVRDLENKWFLGLDHPNVTVGSYNGGTYQVATGLLFGAGGPVYTDIQQGNVGDCYLLAALGATAARSPQAIRNMFTDNGDGTYSVRFYNNGAPEYVTVDRSLPGGGNVFASTNPGSVWVALAEKAFVEINESGWLNTTIAGLNSYSAIDGGNDWTALNAINGRTASGGGLSSAASGALVDIAWTTGQAVVLYTTGMPYSALVVSDHIYAVVGYNAATNLYILYNPWGNNGHTETNPTTGKQDSKPAIIQLSSQNMHSYFKGFDFSATGSATPNQMTARPDSQAATKVAAQPAPVIVPLAVGDGATTPAATGDDAAVAVQVGNAHPRRTVGAWAART